MDYKYLISNRKSVRNYKKTAVKEQLLNQLKDFSETSRKLIPGIETEILILNKADVYSQIDGMAGYNGIMLEAPHYIFVLSDKRDYYIENIGYFGENIALKAFELGISSCWVMFKDGEEIKQKLNIISDKELVAIIALGYDNNKTKVINMSKVGENESKTKISVVKNNTSSRYGVEDVVYMYKWGNNANADELSNRGLLNGFHYARLAPSTLNRQPWRFIIDDGIIVLAVRADEQAHTYEEKIDAGIVMLYFEVIIDATLFDLTWHMGNPDKDYEVPEDFEIVSYCSI